MEECSRNGVEIASSLGMPLSPDFNFVDLLNQLEALK
jgi:hypothetical protein